MGLFRVMFRFSSNPSLLNHPLFKSLPMTSSANNNPDSQRLWNDISATYQAEKWRFVGRLLDQGQLDQGQLEEIVQEAAEVVSTGGIEALNPALKTLEKLVSSSPDFGEVV